MTRSLLEPVGSLSPQETLRLAQQAPAILRKTPKAFSSSPLASLFSSSETAETWTIYENLMIVCLRVGDDAAANECLGRITARFGENHERVLALRGLFKEATASSTADLQKILDEYETLLQENDANIPVLKRKIALLRSTDRLSEAITALNSLLEICPTDPEAWAELADMYVFQGLYPQAIFALEEVLIFSPNAWNIQARLGEVSLMAASVGSEGGPFKHYAEALKRFCRSIELCDDYLRGYYGLKLTTDKLLDSAPKSKKDSEGFSLPETATVEKLNQVATEKLANIVRRYSANERGWQGYEAAEIAAARELLDSVSASIVR